MNDHIIGGSVAFILLIAIFGDFGSRASSQSESWSDEEVAVARLCVSERSFALYARDCDLIAGIVSRAARARGMAVDDYVALVHHRHTHSRSRPWIGQLDGSLSQPLDWPTESLGWDIGRDLWRQTLLQVRGALSGNGARCRGGLPSTWGGRVVDRERIQRMTSATGAYRLLDCGRTINSFLARRR